MTDEEWVAEALANMPPICESKKAQLALLFRADFTETSEGYVDHGRK
jgi:hypothetical protein